MVLKLYLRVSFINMIPIDSEGEYYSSHHPMLLQCDQAVAIVVV